MSCDFRFPESLPVGCVTQLVEDFREGDLFTDKWRTIKAATSVMLYLAGLAEQSRVIGSSGIESTEPIDESDEAMLAALEKLTVREGGAVGAFPIAPILLSAIIGFIIRKLLEKAGGDKEEARRLAKLLRGLFK